MIFLQLSFFFFFYFFVFVFPFGFIIMCIYSLNLISFLCILMPCFVACVCLHLKNKKMRRFLCFKLLWRAVNLVFVCNLFCILESSLNIEIYGCYNFSLVLQIVFTFLFTHNIFSLLAASVFLLFFFVILILLLYRNSTLLLYFSCTHTLYTYLYKISLKKYEEKEKKKKEQHKI